MPVDSKAPGGVKYEAPKVPFLGKLVVGGVAGVFGTLCVFPLDMTKTRLQNQVGNQYKGVVDCFRQMIRKEGLRGMYKGIGANLVGVTPEKAIKLAANDYFREQYANDDGSIALPFEMLAGASAGFCQVTATNPMEIVKIRLQLQSTLPKAEQRTAIQVVQHLGLRGLYRGTLATWMRDVPYSIVFFPMYAHIKKALKDPVTGETGIPGLLAAGGSAGAFAASMVTPADVIKTRLQVRNAAYKSIPEAFHGIRLNEGYGAFYKGVVPRAAVQAPLFGIALVAFELQQRWYIKYQREQQDSEI